MNGTSETHPHSVQGFLRETVAGSSLTEGVGAVATIILAILGLAGIFTNIVASAATIVVGAVILTDGLLLSAEANRLNSQSRLALRASGIGGGVTAGFFGGLAAIVLGILSFFRMAPEPLLAVALLVVGAAMLLGGGAISRLNWLLTDQPASSETAGMVITGSGSMFVGLAAVVLGILAVIGLAPMTLILVGLLSLGAAALFNGSPLHNAA